MNRNSAAADFAIRRNVGPLKYSGKARRGRKSASAMQRSGRPSKSDRQAGPDARPKFFWPLPVWHECEVTTASRNVRVRGQSGKHVLVLSSSQFAPSRTYGAGLLVQSGSLLELLEQRLR